jgi:hypothetical protein
MPVIRITRMDGELVYEGEGELVLDPDPFAPGRQGRIAIRQERRRDGEIMGRQLDITELLTQTGSRYTRSTYFPPMGLAFDPSADPLTVPLPPEPAQVVTELRIEGEAPWLDWLRNVLEEPVETPEERRARREQWENARRTAMALAELPPDQIRWDLGLPPLAVAPDTERIRYVPSADLTLAMAEHICQTAPELEAFRRSIAEAYDLPESILGPDPAHDELIESTRSEFPHDPLQYGRIYPGDAGTSRWTPPDDPNEKIRSCP